MISKFTIKQDSSIEQVIKKLNSSGLKTVFVVSSKNKLIGSISDGDLRKKIYFNKNNKFKAKDICNKKPFYILEKKFNFEEIQSKILQNKYDLIPVINNQNSIIKILEPSQINNLKEKISLIIIAGGLGKRLAPLSNVIPKPLIPIKNKPIIQIIIENFKIYFNINTFVSLNYKSQLIKSYFINELKHLKPFNFIVEKKPLDTIGAISLINKKKLSENFFVSNCDIVCSVNLNLMYEFHLKNNYDITLLTSEHYTEIPYGCCILAKNKKTLISLKEKPKYKHNVNIGLYIFNKNVMSLIKKNKPLRFDELLTKVIKKRKDSVGVYNINSENWTDIGNWESYKNSIHGTDDDKD